MTIDVTCDCGAQLKVREDKIGKQARCPKCRQPILLIAEDRPAASTAGESLSSPTPTTGRTADQNRLRIKIILFSVLGGGLLLTAAIVLVLALPIGDDENGAGRQNNELPAYRSASKDFESQNARLNELREEYRRTSRPINAKLIAIEMMNEGRMSKELALTLGVNPDRLIDQKKELESKLANLPEKKTLDEQRARFERAKAALTNAEDAVMDSTTVSQTERYTIAQEIHKRATDRLKELRSIDEKLRAFATKRIRDEFVGESWKNLQSRHAARQKMRDIRGNRMSASERLKELDLETEELQNFKKKTLEFERLAETPRSVVRKKLDAAYEAMWTTAEIREQKRSVERANDFLKQSEAN